jgi:hypothetical protein
MREAERSEADVFRVRRRCAQGPRDNRETEVAAPVEAILRPKIRRGDSLRPLARSVRRFGGRALDRICLDVLDADADSPCVVRTHRASRESREILLSASGALIEPYGLAHTAGGALWVIADRGRELLRFDDETGRLVEARPLAGTFTGLWSLAGSLILARAPVRAGDPLLFRDEDGSLVAFSSLCARPGGEGASLLFDNLLAAGPSAGAELLFWRVADGSELYSVNDRGETSRMDALTAESRTGCVPELALRDADAGRPDAAAIPLIADALAASEDICWILVRPLRGAEDRLLRTGGATASWHVLAGRYAAILETRSGHVHLLRSDGASDWVSVPSREQLEGARSEA